MHGVYCLKVVSQGWHKKQDHVSSSLWLMRAFWGMDGRSTVEKYFFGDSKTGRSSDDLAGDYFRVLRENR